MTTYAIYDHPKDYPGKFVVRQWESMMGTPIPGSAKTADSLVAARRFIPAGLQRLARFENDDPTIVEVWI